MVRALIAASLIAAFARPSLALTPVPGKQPFERAIDAYYAELSAAHPTDGTELGLHDHDSDLESMSAASMKAEGARLRRWQARFQAIAAATLPPAAATDLELVRLGISSRLIDLEEIQRWRHHPDVYSGLASRSIYVLIKRDFAPLEKRLESVIAREQKIPALLLEGEKNLSGVPKVAVEIALDEIPGIVEFFEKDVPLAFVSLTDAGRRARLVESTARVKTALTRYAAYLQREVMPKATAPFAIGEALFRKKLAADEMIDTPLDELLARGEAELARLQSQFRAEAQKIDASKPAERVQEEMQKDHPSASTLIGDVQARLAGLRKFLVDRDLVGLPSAVMPRVEETPPFMRATTLASMETPGPFETRATEAYYNVTLPEKSWSAAQAEDFLRGAFSRPVVDVTSIHEAFPGHYVQFLWLPQNPSKVRKIEGANSNIEGWAHYCEQMMLDEGWGAGDPKLRLAQLQDALLRAARFVVGVRMHTRGMTLAQAAEFFHKEGMQSRKVAEMETRRGTEDPTYLYYTLGKLEILRLRDDYRKKLGAAFSLRKFHNAFLAEGAIHLPLMRRALLP